MLQDKYKELINTLLNLTQSGILKWENADRNMSYQVIPADGKKFLIDKYYSISGSNRVVCLNLTIFEDSGESKILDEIVFCSLDDDKEQKDNFALLSVLYKEIESACDQKAGINKAPVITSITESLNRMISNR